VRRLHLSNAVLVVLLLFLSSCYSLNLHESAKVLEKGDKTVQFSGSLVGVPKLFIKGEDDAIEGVDLPKVALNYGFGGGWQLGFSAGLLNAGINAKYQWLGDFKSKFAIANGLNLFANAIVEKRFDLLFNNRGDVIYGIELPLYTSYHPAEHLSVYLHPVITYVKYSPTEEFSEPQFFGTGWYKGAVIGIRLDRTVHMLGRDVPLIRSLELSGNSPLIGDAVNICIGGSIGWRF
jgi:hypothetical protein